MEQRSQEDLNLGGAERLLEVGPDLVDVLEPNAEPQEPRRDARALPAGAALHRRVRTAEARCVEDQPVVEVSTDRGSSTSKAIRPEKPG